jgi:anti-sigma regulatory factor (Ser/Thr protein kinase)
VSAILEAEGADDARWTATQVVSELATNAVVHAATAFTVTVVVDDGLVRVAVTDAKPLVAVTQRPFSASTTTGRGLRLVERMSRSWGVETTPTNKTVWCEIVRTTSGGQPEPSTVTELRGASTSEVPLPAPARPPAEEDATPTFEARATRLAA